MPTAPPFIRSLTLRNFLSFGPESSTIELGPLNVLIGPNGSGKSNLLEAIGVFRATPTNVSRPIHELGGPTEWIWNGLLENEHGTQFEAQLEAVVEPHFGLQRGSVGIRHGFTLLGGPLGVGPIVENETIEDEMATSNEGKPLLYCRRDNSGAILNAVATPSANGTPKREERRVEKENLILGESILSQIREPSLYYELAYLSYEWNSVRIYREWALGRDTLPRQPQKADLPSDFLLETLSNLALIVSSLNERGETRKRLLEEMQRFCPSIEAITTRIIGGTVQIFIEEKGLRDPLPATRVSDGTLRYLCLLTVLCHPEPPRVICIEEPEIGLHPDALRRLGELMVEASGRTQLIVTTQSDALVSALTDHPEAVLICERDETGTHMRRLDPERLAKWIEDYQLGDLWRMGELGGNP
jgi:predicted ATPase